MLLLLLAAFSCGRREEIPHSQPEPRLRSITIGLQNLVLPEGGTAEVPFSVKDPDFVIGPVRLQVADGTEPSAFRLQEVITGDAGRLQGHPGRYRYGDGL